MEKKSKLSTILWIITTIAILSILGYLMLSNETTKQETFPATCSLTNSGTTATSYLCPSTKTSCDVKVTLNCNTQVSTPKVILRWSSNIFKPEQIAFDRDDDGDLDMLKSTDEQYSVNKLTRILTFPSPIDTSYLSRDGSIIAVCYPSSSGSITCRKYLDNPGGTISTDSNPTVPYTSSGLEKVDGNTPSFQCIQNVTGGATRTVTYSGVIAGTKTDSFTIVSGKTIWWAGKIDYTERETRNSECVRNIKSTSVNSYYICIKDQNGCGIIDKSKEISCGTSIFDEITGTCVKPTTCKTSTGVNLNVGQSLCTSTSKLEACKSTSDIPTIIVTNVILPQICKDGIIVKPTTCTASNGQILDIGKSVCTSISKLETCYATSENPAITVTNAVLPKICKDGVIVKPTTCTTSIGTTINIGQSVCVNQLTLETCTATADNPAIIITKAVSPKICKDGIIDDAYTVNINLNKQIISTSEKFDISFELTDTTNNKNIDITVQILKGSSVIYSDIQRTGNTIWDEGKATFSFDSPPIGFYTLRISFSHPNGNYKKDYNVQVTDSLGVTLSTDNPIQFDIKPIEVTLSSYKSGSLKDLTNDEIDAIFNGIKVYSISKSPVSLGILKYKFNLKGDGILRIRARGMDESGLWTEYPLDYFEIIVKKSTVLFTTNFVYDVCVGSQTNLFETKDSSGSYIDTTNTVIIEKPLGGKDTATITGSGGKYSFTYNFAEGGLYTIKLTSSNPILGSSQLNNGQGETINILAGAACNEVGPGIEGGINWTLYIIIGVAGIGVILFIWLVFIKKR